MLLLAGVLVFSDVGALAWAGCAATVAMLFTVGFVERRLRAVAWAAILVVSACAADVLWQLDWALFDRSDDYEPLPQTPFVLIALPIPMAAIAVGVGSAALWRRIRSKPNGPYVFVGRASGSYATPYGNGARPGESALLRSPGWSGEGARAGAAASASIR